MKGFPGAKREKVKFTRLFRFATGTDAVILFFGTLSALGNGCVMPAFALVRFHVSCALSSNLTLTFEPPRAHR